MRWLRSERSLGSWRFALLNVLVLVVLVALMSRQATASHLGGEVEVTATCTGCTYDGTWTTTADAAAHAGSYHWVNWSGSNYFQLSITLGAASTIQFYGLKTANGQADRKVSIDGAASVVAFNDFSGSTQYQQLLYTTPELAAGSHTVKFDRGTGSGFTYFDFYRVVATPPPTTTTTEATTTTAAPTTTTAPPEDLDLASLDYHVTLGLGLLVFLLAAWDVGTLGRGWTG